MGVWAAAASCGCPKASFHCQRKKRAARSASAHGQRRQGQHHCPPCPPTCPSRPPCCGGRFRTCARAATARELSFREKNCRRPHEIWARRSGHFSMPATALHRSESYLSRPVAPFNAAGRTLFGPTRVPHDGFRIPPARSCPPLCLKVLCEPVDSCFSLKLLNGFYTKPV